MGVGTEHGVLVLYDKLNNRYAVKEYVENTKQCCTCIYILMLVSDLLQVTYLEKKRSVTIYASKSFRHQNLLLLMHYYEQVLMSYPAVLCMHFLMIKYVTTKKPFRCLIFFCYFPHHDMAVGLYNI